MGVGDKTISKTWLTALRKLGVLLGTQTSEELLPSKWTVGWKSSWAFRKASGGSGGEAGKKRRRKHPMQKKLPSPRAALASRTFSTNVNVLCLSGLIGQPPALCGH